MRRNPPFTLKPQEFAEDPQSRLDRRGRWRRARPCGAGRHSLGGSQVFHSRTRSHRGSTFPTHGRPSQGESAQPPRLPLRHSLRYLSKARRSPPFRQGRPCQRPILGEAKRHSMYHLRQSPCRRNRASHRALMRLSQTALLRVPSRRLRKRWGICHCRVPGRRRASILVPLQARHSRRQRG